LKGKMRGENLNYLWLENKNLGSIDHRLTGTWNPDQAMGDGVKSKET